MARTRPSPHRPRGRVRHLAAVMNPTAAVAGKVALERDADLRLRRLVAAARDGARQRLRPTRDSMRALTASPGARIRWRAVPAPPDPGPLGAVVHPIAVATCDLDRALMLGSTPFALPLCMGHECVADVLRVGSEVTGVAPGDRVVVPFQISCGACAMCRAGFTANCTSVPPISMYGFGVGGGHWGGTLSDELAVPFADGMLVPLPEGVDPAAAASVADNVSDGYRHLGPHLPAVLDRDPDAEVRIIGAQRRRVPYGPSVSLYAGLVARALGARRVRMVEARAHVRAQAASLGIETVTPSEARGLPTAPLVVDVSFEPPGLKRALEATSPDGVCTSSGSLHRAAKVPIALMYGRNVNFHVGRTQARAVIPAVLELMASGRLQPERVTDCLADLDDAPRALHEHARGNMTKTIVAELS